MGPRTSFGSVSGRGGCKSGEVRKPDGTCAPPVISREVFAFVPPSTPAPRFEAPDIPDPKIEQRVVFVRAPNHPENPDPIIVPGPQQQTTVYVLTKNTDLEQKIIEAPAGPAPAPEVHYVAYDNESSLEELEGFNLKAVFDDASVGKGIEFDHSNESEERFGGPRFTSFSNSGRSRNSGSFSSSSFSRFGSRTPSATYGTF